MTATVSDSPQFRVMQLLPGLAECIGCGDNVAQRQHLELGANRLGVTLGDVAQPIDPFLARACIDGPQFQNVAGCAANGEGARVLVTGTDHGSGQMLLTEGKNNRFASDRHTRREANRIDTRRTCHLGVLPTIGCAESSAEFSHR